MAGQITDSLIEAMKIMSNDDKETAYECTIIRSIDSMTGEYELDYMSNKIRAYSMDSSKTYSPGDLVFVIAPQGDFNDVKYILGLANPKKIAASPQDKEDENDKYVNLTDDLLDVDKNTDIFGLKSYEDINMKDITSGVCNNSRFIERITKYINGKKERTLKFSADIKTSLNNEQMYSGGEYGISISIPFVEEGYKEYKLDSTKMLGSPMSLLDWTTQTLEIQLDRDKIYDSTRPPIVKIYKENFIEEEEKVPEDFDIKFKNISLYVTGKLTSEEFNGYYVYLFATGGNYFLSSDSVDAFKYITATLKAKGSDVDTTNDSIYWFEEDPNITSSSPEYLDVGGIGWKCINPINTSEVTNEDGTTSSVTSFKNRVEKIEVKAKAIQGNKRYKCVIVHNKIPYFNEIMIYKESNDFELVLESLSGEEISIHETDVKLKLKFYYKGITENPNYALRVVYDWVKEDWNGVEDDNFQKHLHFSKKNEIVKEGAKTYYVTTADFPTEIIDGYAVIRVRVYIDGKIPGFEDFKTEEKHYISSTEIEIKIIEEEDPALEDIRKSTPKLLFDYNVEDVVVKQTSSIIASITCKILRKTDVQGHFLMNFVATEYCNVILRFMDNDMTELFCPLTYTVQPGHNSIGVPHSYLFRLAGLHSFTVSAQCTSGQLNVPVRGILYTIDSGYLVEKTLNMTSDVLDLSLSQTSIDGIDEFWTIGIENKVAILKSQLFEAEITSAWKLRYNFSDVKDASIDFNGYWTPRNNDAYTLITDKWPFVAIVDKESLLKIYTYDEDSAEYVAQQLDTNVKQVSLCKGYSSTIYPEQDQGMVCAYVKNDNTVWYTHYSYNTALKQVIWHEPIHIDELSDVLHVSVNRTNDYRIGICVTTKNENKWYLTERTYVNQAIRPEKTNVKINHKRSLLYMGPNVEIKTAATPYVLSENCEEIPNIVYGTYDGPIIFYPDVIQKSLFTVYLNDVKTSNFSVYNDNAGKLGVYINQSMTGIRKIRVIFNNDNRDAYISKGGIGYGWHAAGYDFTWTPVVVHRIRNEESFNIRSTAMANVECKQLLTTEISTNKEQLNIGVNADGLVQLFERREIKKKMPAENFSVNISADSASVVQSQIGESPI